MTVTARQDHALRTLDAVYKAANASDLHPTWTIKHDEVLFDCPQCRQDGIPKQRAHAEQAPSGGIRADCNACGDDIAPGIIKLLEQAHPTTVTHLHPQRNGAPLEPRTLDTQTWRDFETTAGQDVPCIINGLWPEGALGFIGAAPKAGKTWMGLDIAISVATGTPVFASFPVPTSHPVLYVALEGHRAAIRARIGCLARGHGVLPEHNGLNNLHIAYKPKGINLAHPDWAAALIQQALELEAKFVIVDVLRRAAQIKENDASSFMELVDLLNPITDQGIALALLHHFNKVNEQTSQRTPAERMAGSGAMFGALDVGLFITKSENQARKLTIHTDIRDLAAPQRFNITLRGVGTGPYGGFTYHDNLRLVMEDAPPERKNIKAPSEDIRDWIINEHAGAASPGEIQLQFGITDSTLRRRRDELAVLGIHYLGDGINARYEASQTTPNPAETSTYPNTPTHPNIGDMLGSPEAPQHRPLLRKGIEMLGSEPLPTQDRAATDVGVNLDQEDDAGYWAMLDTINPETEDE